MTKGTNGGGAAGNSEHNSPPATLGHNSAKRDAALNGKIERWCDLQDKEDALIKQYIKPIRAEKAELKAEAKDDYEIPTKAFNARANLRWIERNGSDSLVLAVNELFQATPVGKNLDLVALAERVASKRASAQQAKTREATL